MWNVDNGRSTEAPDAGPTMRVIEIDLSDLGLPADMPTPDHLAVAAAHVYERFVRYADEGWEWVTYPGSRAFDGWVSAERVLVGARLLSRRVAPEESATVARPTHGVSAYRTRQLTGRSWTAEPGSKTWKSFGAKEGGRKP
jgi:hypothetical protein